MAKRRKALDASVCALYPTHCSGGRAPAQRSPTDAQRAALPESLGNARLRYCAYCQAVYTPGGLTDFPQMHGKLVIDGGEMKFSVWKGV